MSYAAPLELSMKGRAGGGGGGNGMEEEEEEEVELDLLDSPTPLRVVSSYSGGLSDLPAEANPDDM